MHCVLLLRRKPSESDVTPLRKGAAAFCMPVFKADFCRQLLEELDHFAATDLPRNKSVWR